MVNNFFSTIDNRFGYINQSAVGVGMISGYPQSVSGVNSEGFVGFNGWVAQEIDGNGSFSFNNRGGTIEGQNIGRANEVTVNGQSVPSQSPQTAPQASVTTTPAQQPTQSPAPAATPAPEQGNANGVGGRVGAVVQGAGQAFSYMAKGTFENAGKAVGAFAKGYQQTFGQQGSMGETKVPASLSRTQTAATNQQQSGYNRQTTAPVKGSVADKFATGAALSAIGTTMAVGFAAAAPLVLAAAPAVAMAYMAIKAAEALMNFFKGGKQQGQPQATSGQQQQPARQQAGQQQPQGQTGQQTQAPAAQATAPVQEGQQAELQTASNASGGTEFTQDVNVGGVQAPSALGFNMDTVSQALAAARGSR